MTTATWLRGTAVVGVAVLCVVATAGAQTVRTTVDCAGNRLSGAEREMCASPELTRLAGEVDALTARLEGTLTGREREALVDTERPVVVERNDCQNNPVDPEVSPAERVGVHDCIQAVLQRRLTGLTQATGTPARIFDEVSRYTFLDVPFVAKWGDRLERKRVRVFGCLILDPGLRIGELATATLRETCATTGEPHVTVSYGTLTRENAAWFENSGGIIMHWMGTLERGRNGELVLDHFGRPQVAC